MPSPHGRAYINPRSAEAWGYCDRCGFLYNLSALQFQYEWRGDVLANTGFRVCRRCMDVPNQQFKTLHIPPDPVPVQNPRPGFTALYMRSPVQDELGAALLDEEGNEIYED